MSGVKPIYAVLFSLLAPLGNCLFHLPRWVNISIQFVRLARQFTCFIRLVWQIRNLFVFFRLIKQIIIQSVYFAGQYSWKNSAVRLAKEHCLPLDSPLNLSLTSGIPRNLNLHLLLSNLPFK